MKGNTFTIGGRKVGSGQPVFIIAEVGVNHNGSLARARKLIDVAVNAGADAVKFQMCDPDEMVTKSAPKAEYQKKNEASESQYDMLKRYYFGVPEHKELMAYAKKKDIIFFSTPFSLKDARELVKLKMPVFKVGSSDTNNHPQLQIIAKAHVPVILSTGMANLAEVKESIAVLRKAGAKNIVVLHCTTAYPTNDKDVNLKAMITMRDALHLPVGYSDHTPGTDVAVAAVALGACVIEKHITLDKKLPGPDHFASLEPKELAALVQAIRRTERILGTGIKGPTKGEKVISQVARKSIVASRAISKGTKVALEDLAFKRPGTGLSPAQTNTLVGKRARRDIKKDELFSRSLVV
ncbi:MAG: N-acetylneuraminate synthase [Minisyncoccia bacterium]